MKSQVENLDQIIRKNFPKDIAFKRVQKEISMLSSLNKNFYKISILNSPIGLKILVETLKAAIQNFCNDPTISNIQMILFEILLEPKFPFIHPKIFCRTTFTKPSLSDGRDIIIDIIKKTWTPSILLHEIITLFPIFIKEILGKSRDLESLQKIGTFHLACMYNLEDFLLMDSVDVFPVNELMPNNKTIPRYLILSHSVVLNFEIIDKKNNQMKLISYAYLQSLLNIKRKKDEQFTLILTWKDQHRSEGLTQIIALEQANKFCELIIKNMKSFGVKISKNIIKQPDLTLDEVTVKAYEQIDIMDLLENITILESRLPEEFTIDIVNTLTMLYQKAVEYYSALNDPAYDVFLEKLHILLSREDVQILLRSKAETNKNSKVEKTKVGNQRKPINEENEEEEEKKENAHQNIQDYFPKSQTKNEDDSPQKIPEVMKKQEKNDDFERKTQNPNAPLIQEENKNEIIPEVNKNELEQVPENIPENNLLEEKMPEIEQEIIDKPNEEQLKNNENMEKTSEISIVNNEEESKLQENDKEIEKFNEKSIENKETEVSSENKPEIIEIENVDKIIDPTEIIQGINQTLDLVEQTTVDEQTKVEENH